MRFRPTTDMTSQSSFVGLNVMNSVPGWVSPGMWPGGQ